MINFLIGFILVLLLNALFDVFTQKNRRFIKARGSFFAIISVFVFNIYNRYDHDRGIFYYLDYPAIAISLGMVAASFLMMAFAYKEHKNLSVMCEKIK